MSNLAFIAKEHKDNWYKIVKLSYYDFIAPLRDTYLGAVWIILSPLLQIGIYWFVFGLGIRKNGAIDGFPFLLWMIAGLVPWFFISKCIGSGSLCIYSKSAILTKMKFPTSIIPTYNTLTQIFNIVPVIFIMIIIYAFNGYKATIFYIQIIYYVFSAMIFCIAISLFTSALVIAVRDINRIVGTFLKFLFYLTPILWKPEKMPWLETILKINPLVYIVNGFRDSMLYNRWFYEDIKSTVYFWGVTIILLVIGSAVHMRFRNRFADLI